MAWQGGSLRDNGDFNALVSRLRIIEQRLGINQSSTDTAIKQMEKRFRIGVKIVTLSIGTATVSFVWSTPLPVDMYPVDVACSAIVGVMPTVTITSQDRNGATVQFASPLVAVGATVVALAVSPTHVSS
jgi:hypothetical protein